MRYLLTDQFLWDIIYPFFDKAENALDFLLSNKYRQISILFGNENPVFRKYRKEKSKKQFSNLIYYLKQNNYIKIKSLEGKIAVMLTNRGIKKITKSYFSEKKQVFNKRKDGKWIMIIFDIPQKHQKARNLLRSVLQNLEYKIFQHSVWVTPYDVFEKTEKLLQFYSLEKYVKIFLIEEI